MPTLQDVAQEAGVSPATVSRTFVSPALLNTETRERVLAAAKRLNYRPRRAAPVRNVASEDYVGFQFFASSASDSLRANAFYAAVLAGAQAEAAARGVHLILNTLHHSPIQEETLPKMARERAVAGMLLVGIGADNAEVIDALREQIPHLVLVDNFDPTGRHDCVLSDGAGGALEATQHLFALGHRRVGFLLSDAKIKTFRERLQGYLEAHYEAGRPIDPTLILSADGLEDTYARLTPFLSSPNRPTALLASNDLAASAVMQACRHLGIDIPGALSLIGFDDLEFGAHTFPTLSTVQIDKEALGRMALRRLHARIHANPAVDGDPPLKLVLPVSLVLRQSCRPFSLDSR